MVIGLPPHVLDIQSNRNRLAQAAQTADRLDTLSTAPSSRTQLLRYMLQWSIADQFDA
jgi:hypothetical protein